MLAISILSIIPMPCFGASRQLNTEKAVRCNPQGRPRAPYTYHVSSRFIRAPRVIFRPSNNQRHSPDLQYLVNTLKCDMGHPKRSCDPPPIVQSKRRTSRGSPGTRYSPSRRTVPVQQNAKHVSPKNCALGVKQRARRT